MHGEHSFSWLALIPGLEHAPTHVVHSIFITLLLLVTMTIARMSLSSATRAGDGVLIPASTMTYRNFFEIIAERLYVLVESVMGQHDAKIYYPFIGTLFVYIFTANFISLIPGFSPPTDNLNTTLALGAFVFIYYNIIGIKVNGFVNHLKHFMGPVIGLAPLIFVIEVISHLIRPFSLALRLKWNIAGDHIVLGAFEGISQYVLPVPFLALGSFVAFIQAFVFCLMTMVYISMSTAHDH